MNADSTRDQRSGADRRTGADRRGTNAKADTGVQPETLEQRRGEDRRGGEQCNSVRGTLRNAGFRSENVHGLLTFELEPLLALCEFAARAQHSLSVFAEIADTDKALDGRLHGLDPEWRYSLQAEDGASVHIGQCLMLARKLCQRAAIEALTAAEDANGASRMLLLQQEGGAA